jgi:5-methylcytosine-specific restriction endonuclease McrA
MLRVKSVNLLNAIAATDDTFHREGHTWVGRCLICRGPLRFDAVTGTGATVEHILPRARGGGNDLHNLGIAHQRCNAEKGIHWDGGRRGRTQPERYEGLIATYLARRAEHWRAPVDAASEET